MYWRPNLTLLRSEERGLLVGAQLDLRPSVGRHSCSPSLTRAGVSMAESLAQVLPLGFPPLMQDRDVGADGEMPDAHVEEVLRLIRGGDLGAGRHAHLDGRFEHAALHHS